MSDLFTATPKTKVKIKEKIAKHYGPGPHPGTGTEQTVHGSGAPSPSIDLEERLGSRRFAPHGDDHEAVLIKIQSMPAFEGWEWDMDTYVRYGDGVDVTEIIGGLRGRKGSVKFLVEHDRAFEADMSSFHDLGTADILLGQARAVEQFLDNPKGRRLFDAYPDVSIEFQEQGDMEGQLNSGEVLSAVGTYNHSQKLIRMAWITKDGYVRDIEGMTETLAHEYGHALDRYLAPGAWSRGRGVIPKMAREFEAQLPLDGYRAAARFAMDWSWGGSQKREEWNPLSERLLKKWSYPGRYRDLTEFVAETVSYYVTDPRVLTDTVIAFNRHYDNTGSVFNGKEVFASKLDTKVMHNWVESALNLRAETEPSAAPVKKADRDDDGWVEGMSVREMELYRQWKKNRIVKHYGPGNHPGTGTSQAVHGHGRSLNIRRDEVLAQGRLTDFDEDPLNENWQHVVGGAYVVDDRVIYLWRGKIYDQVEGQLTMDLSDSVANQHLQNQADIVNRFLDDPRGKAIWDSVYNEPFEIKFVGEVQGASQTVAGQYSPVNQLVQLRVLGWEKIADLPFMPSIFPRTDEAIQHTMAHELGHVVDFAAGDRLVSSGFADKRTMLGEEFYPETFSENSLEKRFHMGFGAEPRSEADRVLGWLIGRAKFGTLAKSQGDHWGYGINAAMNGDGGKEFFSEAVANYYAKPALLKSLVRSYNKSKDKSIAEYEGYSYKTPAAKRAYREKMEAKKVDPRALIKWVEDGLRLANPEVEIPITKIAAEPPPLDVTLPPGDLSADDLPDPELAEGLTPDEIRFLGL